MTLGSMSPVQRMLLLPLKIRYTRKIKGGREKKHSGNWGSMHSSHVFPSNSVGTSSRHRQQANRHSTGTRLGKGVQVLLVAKAVSMAEFDHKEKVKTRFPIQVHGPT